MLNKKKEYSEEEIKAIVEKIVKENPITITKEDELYCAEFEKEVDKWLDSLPEDSVEKCLINEMFPSD